MKYAAARPQIRSGDLLAWSHRGWRTWYDLQLQAIRIFTRSEYVHVGVAWCVGERVLVLEAVSSGVRIFPLSLALPCFWIPLGVWSPEAETRALSQVGKPYSRWQAVLGGLGTLQGGVDERWQCAEYVATILGLKCAYTPSGVVSAVLPNSHLTRIE